MTDVPRIFNPQPVEYWLRLQMPEMANERLFEALEGVPERLRVLAFEEDDPEAALEFLNELKRQGASPRHYSLCLVDLFWRAGALAAMSTVARHLVRRGLPKCEKHTLLLWACSAELVLMNEFINELKDVP